MRPIFILFCLLYHNENDNWSYWYSGLNNLALGPVQYPSLVYAVFIFCFVMSFATFLSCCVYSVVFCPMSFTNNWIHIIKTANYPDILTCLWWHRKYRVIAVTFPADLKVFIFQRLQETQTGDDWSTNINRKVQNSRKKTSDLTAYKDTASYTTTS